MKKFFIVLCAMAMAQMSFAQIIVNYAGNGTSGSSGDGGLANAAQLNVPAELAVDAAGNIYICEYNGRRIRKVDLSGHITTFAGTGAAGTTGDGGPATAATFQAPAGIAFDPAGNLYVADLYGYSIRKITPAGIISKAVGTGAVGSLGDGGPATAAHVHGPHTLAFDGAGNLYFTDYFDQRIRKVTPSGIISTVAGTGAIGYSGDGGPATAATMYQPVGIISDVAGNLYFADQMNQVVRKVSASGIISLYAGMPGSAGYSGDGGPATNAKFNIPNMVILDNSGNLYVGDQYNNVVRKVNASGIITTAAGDGTVGHSGDGGPATVAQLSDPAGMAIDAVGNLYIADAFNHCVREIPVSDPGLSVTGSNNICEGSTSALTASLADGTWSSSNPGVAPVGGTSGIVSGMSVGTTIITYTVGTSSTTTTITVNPLPAAITGPMGVDVGSSVTLSDATPGGSWSSSDPSVATVTLSSGVVYGLIAGTVTVTYTLPTGCYRTTLIKVYPLTGISGISGTDVGIYPNPVAGAFIFTAAQQGVLAVYTLEGREVLHTNVRVGDNRIAMPADIANGVYICRFSGDDGIGTILRLVVTR